MIIYKQIEKSFSQIEKLFSKKALLEFSKNRPGHLKEYNFGLGTMIRLKVLRPKSTLYLSFIKNGFIDRDEMTMEIIKAYHRHLHYIHK